MMLINDERDKINDVYERMLLGEVEPKNALLFFQNKNRYYKAKESYLEMRDERKTFPNLNNNLVWMESYKEAKQNFEDEQLLNNYIKKANSMLTWEGKDYLIQNNFINDDGSPIKSLDDTVSAYLYYLYSQGKNNNVTWQFLRTRFPKNDGKPYNEKKYQDALTAANNSII